MYNYSHYKILLDDFRVEFIFYMTEDRLEDLIPLYDL